MVDFSKYQKKVEVSTPIVVIPKKNKTIKKEKLDTMTSDEIRTAYYLITKKSTRKTIEEIKKDIIEELSKKNDKGDII